MLFISLVMQPGKITYPRNLEYAFKAVTIQIARRKSNLFSPIARSTNNSLLAFALVTCARSSRSRTYITGYIVYAKAIAFNV
ncbi:hypothetical protein SDC9_84554 [bioreactor metagenome]|uniref:Uncharacterized protein n=1 Tax=bioreactor metagenome TaxID=1076179 RepID=A0A644ZAM8_9ZZZZ